MLYFAERCACKEMFSYRHWSHTDRPSVALKEPLVGIKDIQQQVPWHSTPPVNVLYMGSCQGDDIEQMSVYTTAVLYRHCSGMCTEATAKNNGKASREKRWHQRLNKYHFMTLGLLIVKMPLKWFRRSVKKTETDRGTRWMSYRVNTWTIWIH